MVSIADAAAVAEGGTASFDVTLDVSYDKTVTVQYATADGSAVAPGDYTAKSGTVTFLRGRTSEPVTVTPTRMDLVESDEGFSVVLSWRSNATMAIASGTGTIKDATALPSVSIDNAGSVGEGGVASFVVTLSASWAAQRRCSMRRRMARRWHRATTPPSPGW